MLASLQKRLWDVVSRRGTRRPSNNADAVKQVHAVRGGKVEKMKRKKKPQSNGEEIEKFLMSGGLRDDEQAPDGGDQPSTKDGMAGATDSTRRSEKPVRKSRSGSLSDSGGDSAGDAVPGISTAEQNSLGLLIGTEAERARRIVTREEKGFEDWTREEIDFYNKMEMRGFEPLMPSNWQHGMESIPDALFTANESEAFITETEGTMFRAQKALDALLQLGVRARDRVVVGKSPEHILVRGIHDYLNWAYYDGGLAKRKFIPIAEIIEARRGEHISDAIARVMATLRSYAEKYRKKWEAKEGEAKRAHFEGKGNGFSPPLPVAGAGAEAKGKGEKGSIMEPADRTVEHHSSSLEEILSNTFAGSDAATGDLDGTAMPSHPPAPSDLLPTLFGVVVTHTVVAIVTCDASDTGRSSRNIALLDFSDADQDVWNAFAVAILIIMVRNWLRGTEAKMGSPVQLDDPDA